MSSEIRLLPPDVFRHTFTLVPRVAICLLVRDAQGGVLLTQRAKEMETMPGAWHLPGAFVLLNETFEACADRIARKELGVPIDGAMRPLGFFEDLDADPRGHVVDLVFEVTLASDPVGTSETEGLRFFGVVPPDVAFHHDRIMRTAGLG
ncbi:MAG: NUDIX domain-containing protein [Fimbriimonas sp.]